MAKNQVSTPAAPAAIGPYSQGITATGTAVYVSGQLPIDPATGAFAGDGITSRWKMSRQSSLQQTMSCPMWSRPPSCSRTSQISAQ